MIKNPCKTQALLWPEYVEYCFRNRPTDFIANQLCKNIINKMYVAKTECRVLKESRQSIN